MNTLITIPFSHYCEKARWALTWCRVPYREQACLPGMHLAHTKRAGGRTVPVLLRAGAAPLVDSTDIMCWADEQAPADRKLFSGDDGARAASERLEDDLDVRLGPAARLWAYAHGLPNRPLLRALVAPGFPRLRDRVVLRLGLPFLAPVIGRQLGVAADSVQKAEAVIATVFEEISALLATRSFLEGERFGAADITFGALGGSLVLPKEHPALASDVALPPEMRAFIDRLKATAAGQYATRLYREYRL